MRLTQLEQGYIDALIFTECGPDSEMSEDASVSPELYAHAREACAKFMELAESIIETMESPGSDTQNGHDLWLTRNGHGAGFWDRGYGEAGEKLSAIATGMGEAWAYEGDDNWIYVSK